MRKSLITLFLLFFLISIISYKTIFKIYFDYKLSKWVEKDVIIGDFNFKFPKTIVIKNLKIQNSNSTYYENIFSSDYIKFDIDLKSYFFSDLVIIDNLEIENSSFYLELNQKKIQLTENKDEKIIFEDNIGVAKKINENLPDRIWPIKKKDKNFIILESSINNSIVFMKISSFKDESKILLSNFDFFNFGNQKGVNHYKDILKIIFFDFIAREKNFEKREILESVYKL
jgi:hypothetical protein|tara:strand:+ start:43 stop:726 length:684 start_codon:yes stop_codon:yes gene_type:complete